MGIRSTRTISRATAISRINEINVMVADRDYRAVEAASHERDHDLRTFVDRGVTVSDASRWTNRMLEELMDEPFYRFSMFDNYRVSDTEED